MTGTSTLERMPLRGAQRLPKRFNRATSSYSRSLAGHHFLSQDRRIRRRREQRMRFLKKFSKVWTLFALEFRAWLLISVSAVIIAIVSVLLFAPFFDVRHIIVRRQESRIQPEDIEQTLRSLYRQRLILVSKGQIWSLLSAAYPDIASIDIKKTYPSTLTVTVYAEEVAAAVIIDDGSTSPASQTGDTIVGSGAYAYITKSGYFITSPIKIISKNPIPTLHLSDWGIHPQNRTRALQPKFLEQIFVARDALRTDFGLQVKDIVVYVRAQEFHIRTNKVTLWFDLRSPLSVQFQRFREFLKTLSIDQAKEYIDLRIADKIVYK